jgi:hypothetical protein
MLRQKFTVQVKTLPDCDDITRFDGTRQASPICRLKRKLSLILKGTVQLQSNNFYIVLRTLLYMQNMLGTSHTFARQSLTKLPLLCLSA